MPTANPLDACVQQIVKDAEFPAFSQYLQELMEADQQEQSAQKLADLVLKDFGLTLKVLQVANSFQYNRSSKTIDSVSRAIMAMGVRTVMAIASSLLFFEHYQKRSPSLKRLMLLSMLSAHHAGRTADAIRFKAREEAHLAGMFRNLGEVLVACHRPVQYSRIVIQTHGGASPSSQACIQHLGFSYDGLARAVGRQWRLPPTLASLWSPPDGGSPGDLGAIAQFAHDTTTAIYRRTSGDVDSRIRLLVSQHGHRLGLDEEAILGIVEGAVDETKPIFSMLNTTIDSVRLGQAPGGKPTQTAASG